MSLVNPVSIKFTLGITFFSVKKNKVDERTNKQTDIPEKNIDPTESKFAATGFKRLSA